MSTDRNCILVLFLSNCRYETNDTDHLDDCSLMDPRTKDLSHLSDSRRKVVKERLISKLIDQNENTLVQPTPVTKPVAGLLTSLLSNTEVPNDQTSMNPTAVEEVDRYLMDKSCTLEDNPLIW